MQRLITSTLSRHWPFVNGSGRILDTLGRNIDLGTGERTARTSDGFTMSVLADDLIGRHILLSGKFDRSIVQVLLDQSRSGDVLLDIGANIGYVSACFLTIVKESRVVCVEPQPEIVDLLGRNLAPFGDRAVIHPVALSDRPGDLRFHINKENRGGSKVSEEGQITVRSVKASDLLATMEKLDLIKIDVEGHEKQIFGVLEESLKRLQPRAILFEDHSASSKIGAVLRNCGYKIHGIDKRLLRTKLVPVPALVKRFSDYLALREHH